MTPQIYSGQQTSLVYFGGGGRLVFRNTLSKLIK